MTKTARNLMLTIILFFSIIIFSIADLPPDPGGGPDPGDEPVGGGSPLGGIAILIIYGAGYGAKKIYEARKGFTN